MRFADVKKLVIPDGEVVKIHTADGVVLWEAQSSEGDLPAGYTQCEYIQFNAKQYIDTGIVCTQDTRIEIKFTRETSTASYMYGVRNSANTASVTAYLSSSGAWRFGNTYRNYTLSQNAINEAIVDSSGIKMDGTKSSYIATVKAFTANATLQLGGSRGTGGGIGSPQFVGKIYEFRMYDNDALVLELLPCINNQGVYGFFDSVKRVFHESQGSAAFTGG